MKRNSLSFKITVFYTSALTIILIIFSMMLYAVVNKILTDDLDYQLEFKATEIINILNIYAKTNNSDNLEQSAKNIIFPETDNSIAMMAGSKENVFIMELNSLNINTTFVGIIDSNENHVIRAEKLTADVIKNLKLNYLKKTFKKITIDNQQIKFINIPFLWKDGKRYILLLGTEMHKITSVLSRFLFFIVIGIIFIIIITSFMGKFIVKTIMHPVTEVANTANKISHKNMDIQAAPYPKDSEMQHLINSFNSMLSRLRESFSHINEFSSLAAHELKTPLTIIRGELELALKNTHTSDEYKEILQTSLEELYKMIKITEDLMTISSLDYNSDCLNFTDFDISAFVKEEIYEKSKILAQMKSITLKCKFLDNKYIILGDKTLLRRMFFNIIDNAVKFTAPGGEIGINMIAEDTCIKILFSDTGEGISTKNIDNVFKKFFRVKTNSQTAGSGLGLSIALSIAKIHGGSIDVASSERGSCFTVVVPFKNIIISQPNL